MQIPNANPKNRFGDPVWYFLAEFPLSEFILDRDKGGELAAGLLFQAVRRLGMPPECVENIDRTLASFANGVRGHFKQGERDLPGRVRIFCQRKIIDDLNSGRATSQPSPAEQAVEPIPSIHHSSTKMSGGWGFFLIERGGNLSIDSSVGPENSVDLYLYREGK